jgi:septal ring factor EnvC (AmiA/AmiB activator)
MTMRNLTLPILTLAVTGSLLLAGAAAAVVSEQLSRLNVEQVELSAEQARNMSRMARLLSVLEQIRRDPPPPLLVRPEDARDAVRAAILVRAMTPELRRQAQIYAREAGEMMRLRRLAAVESEALFTTDSQRADSLPEASLEAAPGVRSQSAATRPPESLVWPVTGPVTRRFGDALSGGGKSNGLTVSPPGIAKVVSPAAGSVQFSGPVQGWGLVVIIRLAGGYHLVLAGLERSSVSIGQSVAAGQAVGWMPDSRQSLSELYLEVRDLGSPVNPETWLQNGAG